jgi:hypothetical protein
VNGKRLHFSKYHLERLIFLKKNCYHKRKIFKKAAFGATLRKVEVVRCKRHFHAYSLAVYRYDPIQRICSKSKLSILGPRQILPPLTKSSTQSRTWCRTFYGENMKNYFDPGAGQSDLTGSNHWAFNILWLASGPKQIGSGLQPASHICFRRIPACGMHAASD